MNIKMNRIFLVMMWIFLGCDPIEDSTTDNNSNNTNNLNNLNNSNNTNNLNNTNNTNNTNNQTIDPAWFEPDPQGRVTENNLLGFTPEMVIITSTALKDSWETYAAMKTTLGMKTAVVTMDAITTEQTGRDEAEQLRNYLISAVDSGDIRFALFGGDKEHVPFRRVSNSIFLDTQYTSNGPSQAYFTNLEVDFDSDGDGQYGEYEDLSLADLRRATFPVGRVPSGTPQEVENYLHKYIAYATGFGSRPTHPLLLSDVATTIPLIGDIDGAEGVETTYSALFPQEFTARVRKHYATQTACDIYGGTLSTPQVIKESLELGYSLVFHNGHGSHGWFTDSLNSAFVESLQNTVPSVFITCACLSGNFADVATSSLSDEWSPQTETQDSAGEKYINGVHGGVAYVGNTATGLGAFGGSQFLHALFEGLFTEDLPTIGEVFNYGRQFMSVADWSIPALPIEMTDDSEWWTQHAVILLGDPSLAIHKQRLEALQLELAGSYLPGYNDLELTLTDSSGVPIPGATVSIFKPGDFYLSATTDANGEARFSFVPYGPRDIQVGATMEGYFSAHATVTPAP
ncbi:carboxypeptidase regulatory-like domain-containing protein [Myxococcota bacterium]|nr:carboxypeptidase regulatory-like domain-containing protein [Myxococcota bacterium]MBU1533792.1 carboxypeptidase regulatory-like domain-containing protein [Myxococcota bacterium]